jgi:hypothetical protein
MTRAVAERRDSGLTRPLKVLVPLIKEELDAGDQAGLEHYRRAGEMLLEAKEQVERGEWGGWLDRHFHLTDRMAQRYMKLAELPKRRVASFSTLSEAVDSPRDSSHAASWRQPVQEITSRVNVEALSREQQDRENEARLMRQLSHQLIDIGYRVLSAKLHPDKAGGSREAMARLNKVRSILKEAI